MEPEEILEKLFDKKIIKIIKHFLKDEQREYYLREVARHTRVSPASTYRILNKLHKMDLIEMQEIKTLKLYKLSINKNVDFIKSIMEVDILDIFIQTALKIPEVEEILLLGLKGKSKSNLLLLGNNIDVSQVKQIIAEIKQKHDYTINQMSLSREQYEQMSSMGLYPGSKKVLYKRA